MEGDERRTRRRGRVNKRKGWKERENPSSSSSSFFPPSVPSVPPCANRRTRVQVGDGGGRRQSTVASVEGGWVVRACVRGASAVLTDENGEGLSFSVAESPFLATKGGTEGGRSVAPLLPLSYFPFLCLSDQQQRQKPGRGTQRRPLSPSFRASL